MPVKTKPDIQTVLLGILALIAGVLVLTLLISLIFGGPKAPEEAPTEPTEEATLPPPEANPYDAADFDYENGYLTCIAGESIMGIDVSEFQHQVDWNAVKEAGVEYVILRVGFRGYSTGAVKADARALANYQGAKAAGLKIGVYFFSQAITSEEARAEANFLLGFTEGWDLQMPVVYDWEYIKAEARTGKMDARTLTDCTIAFCETIQAAGHTPMVYFNKNQGEKLLYLEELTDYPFWLAWYSDEMDYPYYVEMWQYTNKGEVPGIKGDVDVNIWMPIE